MKDELDEAGASPAAIERARKLVRLAKRQVDAERATFERLDAKRVEAANELVKAEARISECLGNYSARLAELEAEALVANANVDRIKAAIAVAPITIERLRRKANVLELARAYADQGELPTEIAAQASMALAEQDALLDADDGTPEALRAAGAKQGLEACVAFSQLATTAATELSRIRRWAGVEPGHAWAIVDGTANNDLHKAEMAARTSQSVLDGHRGRPAALDGAMTKARAILESTSNKAALGKARLDEAVNAWANAEAVLTAMVEADAVSMSTDNADFTMFKVTVEHEAYGDGEYADLCASHAPYEAEFDDEEADVDADQDRRVAAVRVALCTAFDFLNSLGGVRCDGPVGDGPNPATFWLAVEGGGWRPAGLARRAPTFELGEYDVPLAEMAGARLKVRCVAEQVRACDAHAAIALTDKLDHVGYWGGEATDELLHPSPFETRRSWLFGIARMPDERDREIKSLAKLEGNLLTYMSRLDFLKMDDREYAVEGRLPYGAITLLVGDGGSGKSTLAQELYAAVNAEEGPKEWLGGAIVASVAGMAGEEDTPHQLLRRQEYFALAWGSHANGPMFPHSGPESMPGLLEWMNALPDNSVVTIDHATAFADGDLTQAHIAARLLHPLNRVAKRKKLAVLLLHHFTKSAPQQAERMAAAIAGSAALKNLVRLVLGMTVLADGRRSITMLKGNVDGVWLQKNESQIFHPDPQSRRLLPVVPEATLVVAGKNAADKDADLLEKVFEAVSRKNREGVEVHKSGVRGIHALDLPELEGIGRNRIQAAVDNLIAAGRLGRGDDGLIANILAENR